jgi:hypothetical protein
VNPQQADAICRLREECYRIAKMIDDGYRAVLGDAYPGGDSERTALIDVGLPTSGHPLVSDVRLVEAATDRWCQWNVGPDTVGDGLAGFEERARALRDNARKLLRWIEGTCVKRAAPSQSPGAAA